MNSNTSFRKCAICNKVKKNTILIDGIVYCKYCLSLIGTVCTKCGNVFITRNDKSLMCNKCLLASKPAAQASPGIHSHSFKPNPVLHFSPLENNDLDSLLMGVEIETDFKTRTAYATSCGIRTNEGATNYLWDKYSDKGRKIYFKSDGTCSGFEMIFNPCTLQYYQREFPMEELLNDIIKLGYVSHNGSSCGIHVHLNRVFFNSLETHKLAYFLNSIKVPLSVFARRYNSNWSKFKDVYRVKYNPKHYIYNYDSDDKYYTVHLRDSTPTIEIRAFRGSLKYKTVLGILEFCDAASRYIKDTLTSRLFKLINNDDVEKLWCDFCEYFLQDTWKYIYLTRYMMVHNLLSDNLINKYPQQIDRAVRIIGEN